MICGICGADYEPTDEDASDILEGITDHACPRCARIITRVRDELRRRQESAAGAHTGPLIPDPDDFGVD